MNYQYHLLRLFAVLLISPFLLAQEVAWDTVVDSVYTFSSPRAVVVHPCKIDTASSERISTWMSSARTFGYHWSSTFDEEPKALRHAIIITNHASNDTNQVLPLSCTTLEEKLTDTKKE